VSRERTPEEQALDSLVSELRELPGPNLDWARVEARLMNEARSGSSNAGPSFFARLRLPLAALAAVATGVFVFAPRHLPTPVELPSKPLAQVQHGPIDGDRLALGTRVSAANQQVSVEHAGRARWTLEPHATAAVVDDGQFLTVRLESGALSASVVPQPKPETFAVEVGGTRVAVHGTAFRVERTADRVLVEVTEGVVAVEPTSTHSDPSFLLRRGSRGSFGLDGRTGSVEGNASVVVHERGPKSHREIAQAKPAPAQAPKASSAPVAVETAPPEPVTPPAVTASTPVVPEQPSIADIETGVSSAVDLMNRCFRETAQSSDVRISVSTGMTLSIAGDGSVQSVTFEPPLAPDVEDCGVAGLRQLTFTKSISGATFTRILELKR